MTYLYNCKHDGDQYRITKFDGDLNVESSYLCTERECECPAGSRPMCRHREMLPLFIRRATVGTDWFLDYDRGGWVQNDLPILALPDGVVALTLDDPIAVHNTIAKAVGEPEAAIPTKPKRRRL